MNRNLNRQIHPIAEADGLSPKKLRKGYEFKYVDIDTDEGAFMANDFSVRSLPTLILVDEQGNEVKRAVGNTAWKDIQ